MATDKNGRTLQLGDFVTVECTVASIGTETVSLRTVESSPNYPNGKSTIVLYGVQTQWEAPPMVPAQPVNPTPVKTTL